MLLSSTFISRFTSTIVAVLLAVFCTDSWAAGALKVLVRAVDEPLEWSRAGQIEESWGRPRLTFELRPETVSSWRLARRGRRTARTILTIPRHYRGAVQWTLDHDPVLMNVPDGFGGWRNLQLRFIIVVLSEDLSEILAIDGAFVGHTGVHSSVPPRASDTLLPGSPRVVNLSQAAPPWRADLLIQPGVQPYFEDRPILEMEANSRDLQKNGYLSMVRGTVRRAGRTGLYVGDISLKREALDAVGYRWHFKSQHRCVRLLTDWVRRPVIRSFGS